MKALIDCARGYNPPTSVIRALAATGTTAAAETIGTLALEDHPARFALTATGEAAIPTLIALIDQGHTWAIDDLAGIATPLAIEKLVALIQSDGSIATRAAWHLASAFEQEITESAISNATSIIIPSSSPRYDWVWQPFSKNSQDTATNVAGRVAYLIAHGNDDLSSVPVSHIDRRIGIPLIGVLGTKQLNLSIENWTRSKELQDLAKKARTSLKAYGKHRSYQQLNIASILLQAARWSVVPTSEVGRLFDLLVDRLRIDGQTLIVLHKLTWPVRATLIAQIVGSRAESRAWQRLSRADWASVSRSMRDFKNPIRTAAILCGISGAAIIGLAATRATLILSGQSHESPLLTWVMIGATAAAILLFFVTTAVDNMAEDTTVRLAACIIFFILSALTGVVTAAVAAFQIVENWLGLLPTLATSALIFTFIIALILIASTRARIENNPLRACLNANAHQQTNSNLIRKTARNDI